MGVKGLTSYIKQAPKSFGDRINISERAAESPNGKFNLAVDGRAFLYWLIEDGAGIDCSTRNQSFCWGDTLMLKWGGDMVELAKTLSNAINQLKGAGVQPFFVFDGSQDQDKEHTTLLRREKDISKGNAAYQMVKNQDRGSLSDPLLPMFITELALEILEKQNIFWVRSEKEADADLDIFVLHHRKGRMYDVYKVYYHLYMKATVCKSKGCAAVLSNDSDFLIFDVAGFIPFWTWEYNKGEAFAFLFTRAKLAGILNIPPTFLPVFSCFLGNDYINPDSYNLHEAIIQKLPKRSRKKKNSSSMGMVEPVASFLSQYYDERGDYSDLACQLFPFKTNSKGGRQAIKPNSCTSKGIAFREALERAIAHYQVCETPSYENKVFGIINCSSPLELEEVIRYQTFWARIVVEDCRQTTAYERCSDIRKGWYRLLMAQGRVKNEEAKKSHSAQPSVTITEFCRKKRKLKRQSVGPTMIYDPLSSSDSWTSLGALEQACRILGIESKYQNLSDLARGSGGAARRGGAAATAAAVGAAAAAAVAHELLLHGRVGINEESSNKKRAKPENAFVKDGGDQSDITAAVVCRNLSDEEPMVMTQPETFSNENEKEMKCGGSLDTTSDKLQQENNSDEEKDGSSYECSEREEDGEDLGVGPDDLVGLAAFLLVVACPAPLHQHSLISETVQLLTHSMKYSNTAPLDDARFLEEWIQMQVIVFHVNLVFHTVGLAEHCVLPTSFSTRLALSLFRYINSSDQKELMCYCPDLVLNPSSSLSRALIQGDGIKVTTGEVSEDSNNSTCEKGEERKDVEETGTVPLLLDHAVQFDQPGPHERKVDAVEACTNDNNHCELWDMNQWRATVASLVVHVG